MEMFNDTRLAIYCPKHVDDLRPQYKKLIGEEVEVAWAGTIEEGPYVGQTMIVFVTPHMVHWSPECDFKFEVNGEKAPEP